MRSLVSIILTAYNEEKHLAECVDSLLAQSYSPLEIIDVDDGSLDKSRKIAEKLPLRLIRQKHLGLGPSRNRGAKEAKGEIIVFCDADLIYDRNYVAKLIDPIIKGKTTGTFHKDELVKNPNNFWSRCWQINDHLPKDRKLPLDMPEKSIHFRAIKRKEFLKVAGFDDIGYLDDRTLSPKLKEKASGVSGAVCWHVNPENWKEVFAEARWHGKSLAKNNFWQTLFQYSFPNTLRRIFLDSWEQKEPLYFIFKFIFDFGINVGIGEFILKRGMAK